MDDFTPGLALAKQFYEDEVRPRLQGVPHAAGRIDAGSEVLGYDTLMSTDHDWSPKRLQVFVERPTIFSLPYAVLDVRTPREFFRHYLNYDIDEPLTAADWLTFPEQKLLTITTGPLFHDGIGMDAIRSRFTYYPHDVWLYQLASVWTRIGQEEHLVGRAGFVGDELGAKIIASRLVRDMMRLGFLMERRYAPYPKWFGTGFRELACADELQPLLEEVLRAETWQDRDERLGRAYASVARMHNRLQLTEPVPEEPRPFFGRPFKSIHLEGDFADKLVSLIQDPEVFEIAKRRLIGGIDVFSDSTDLVSHEVWRPVVRGFFEAEH
jgi:hypothetical protein